MRRLSLKKETLVELGYGELVAVVGASFPSKYNCTESYQVCLSEDACVASLGTCVLSNATVCHTQTC
jgi:hypothetical protein